MIEALDIDRDELQKLADELRSSEDGKAFGAAFMESVVLGWMNFCASLSLGEKQPGEPDMRGANVSGGVGDSHLMPDNPWIGPHDGFIDFA